MPHGHAAVQGHADGCSSGGGVVDPAHALLLTGDWSTIATAATLQQLHLRGGSRSERHSG